MSTPLSTSTSTSTSTTVVSFSLTGVELAKLKRSVGMALYSVLLGKRVVVQLVREQIAVGILVFIDECNNCILQSMDDPSVHLYIPEKKSANCIGFKRLDLKSIYIRGNKIRYIEPLSSRPMTISDVHREIGRTVSAILFVASFILPFY